MDQKAPSVVSREQKVSKDTNKPWQEVELAKLEKDRVKSFRQGRDTDGAMSDRYYC